MTVMEIIYLIAGTVIAGIIGCFISEYIFAYNHKLNEDYSDEQSEKAEDGNDVHGD